MRTYELKVKGKKVSSRNPDIRTAVCSNKWESTALATLRDIIIQIVESIYTKIFITSSYILLRIQLHLISLGPCSKINHYKKLMNRNHEYEQIKSNKLNRIV